MAEVVLAVPAYIWTMIFLMFNATVTIILWGVELKPFLMTFKDIKLPEATNTEDLNFIQAIISLCKQLAQAINFIFQVLVRARNAIPFVIDFSITMFLMGALGLSGTMGASLSLFMSNVISAIIIVVIKSMENKNV